MDGSKAPGPDHEGLQALVQIEAWKRQIEDSVAPDPGRLAEGWEFRFLADGTRAEEMESLYRELGFEVLAEPVHPDAMARECRGCALVAALRFRMIYTRRPV